MNAARGVCMSWTMSMQPNGGVIGKDAIDDKARPRALIVPTGSSQG